MVFVSVVSLIPGGGDVQQAIVLGYIHPEHYAASTDDG